MSDGRLSILYKAAIALHVGLIAAVSLTVARLDASVPIALAIGGTAVMPLLLTLPGLARGRSRPIQWLTVVLVAYVGVGTVEVIAATTPAAIAMLLLAFAELGLLLMLTRRRR